MTVRELVVYDLDDALGDKTPTFEHISQNVPIAKIPLLSRITEPALEYISRRMDGQHVDLAINAYVNLLNIRGFTRESLYEDARKLRIKIIPEIARMIMLNSENGVYQVAVSCGLDMLELGFLDSSGFRKYYQKVYTNETCQKSDGKIGVKVSILPQTKPLYVMKAIRDLECETGFKLRVKSVVVDGTTDIPMVDFVKRKFGAKVFLSPTISRRLRKKLETFYGAVPITEVEDVNVHMEMNPPGVEEITQVAHHCGQKSTKSD